MPSSTHNSQDERFAFFGSDIFSVRILNALQEGGFTPSLVITTPDTQSGRGQKYTPSAVKVWAQEKKIPFLTPQSLKEEGILETLEKEAFTFFIVASYGKIIPKDMVELPPKGAINVHPSLLPKLRGASPIESSILTENKTGVSIMLMDEMMDHGPLLAKKTLDIPGFPLPASDLEMLLAEKGGELLLEALPAWLGGMITPRAQTHQHATFTKKLQKSDARIDMKEAPETNYRKILAYECYKPYFFVTIGKKEMRIIIKKAHLENGALHLDRVLPEGRKEISYPELMRWQEEEGAGQ